MYFWFKGSFSLIHPGKNLNEKGLALLGVCFNCKAGSKKYIRTCKTLWWSTKMKKWIRLNYSDRPYMDNNKDVWEAAAVCGFAQNDNIPEMKSRPWQVISAAPSRALHHDNVRVAIKLPRIASSKPVWTNRQSQPLISNTTQTNPNWMCQKLDALRDGRTRWRTCVCARTHAILQSR